MRGLFLLAFRERQNFAIHRNIFHLDTFDDRGVMSLRSWLYALNIASARRCDI
jgi:hypothetical protein